MHNRPPLGLGSDHRDLGIGSKVTPPLPNGDEVIYFFHEKMVKDYVILSRKALFPSERKGHGDDDDDDDDDIF